MATIKQLEKVLYSIFNEGVVNGYIEKINAIDFDKPELLNDIVKTPKNIDELIKDYQTRSNYLWIDFYYGKEYYDMVMRLADRIPITQTAWWKFESVIKPRIANKSDFLGKLKEFIEWLDSPLYGNYLRWINQELDNNFIQKSGISFNDA